MPHPFRSIYCLLLAFFGADYATLLSQNNAFFYYYDQKVSLTIADDAVLVVLEGDVEKHARDLATEANGLVWQRTWRPVKSAVYTFSASTSYQTLREKLKADRRVYNIMPAYRTPEGELWWAYDRVILQAKTAADQVALERKCAEMDLRLKETFRYGPHTPPIQVYQTARFQNPLETANQLHELGLTLFAQADFNFPAHSDFVPNDAGFNQQGFFNRSNDRDIDAPEAWDITQGDPNLAVAVIDGHGYDLNHPDMVGKFVSPYNAPDDTDDPSGTPEDQHLHGTPCAGLVGAATNNGIGIAGTGFNIKVMPILIGYDLNASGGFNTNNTIIARAANKIIAANNVVAVSNSWGSTGPDAAREQIFTQMRIAGRDGLGAAVLASSGNDNANLVRYPGHFQGVVSVGATDQNDRRVSNAIWGSNYSISVDVMAPGLDAYTTDRRGNVGYSSGDYTAFSGTSASCPIAAGVVGLMASVNPSLSGDELATLLQLSTEKVGGYNYYNWLPTRPLGTWHFEMGYGRINAFDAVKAAAAPRLEVLDVSDKQANCRWTAISGALNYTFRYRERGASAWTISTETSPNRLLTVLSGGTTYECQVAANFNTGKQGNFSTALFFTTPGAVLLAWNAPQTNALGVSTGLSVWVHANTNWSISDDQPWLTVSPTDGSTDEEVYVKLSANGTTTPRTATLSLTDGALTRTLTITQAGALPTTLTVSPSTTNLPPRADTLSINVTSNVSWTAVESQDWLSVPVATGTGNGRIRLQFTANNAPTARTATLSVNGGGITRNITISQAAVTLTASPSVLNVGPFGGDAPIAVSGNATWTASSNQSWINLSPANGTGIGTITVTCPTNPDPVARTGTITIAGNNIARTVTVNQAANTFNTNCDNDQEPGNNTVAGAAVLTLGQEKLSRLGTAGDTDFWRFSLVGNHVVFIHLDLLAADFDLSIQNSVGATVGASGQSGTREEFLETVLGSGTYYIKVNGKNNAFHNAACYRLKASVVAVGNCQNGDEPANDSLSTAPTVPFNAYRFSQLRHAADVDYWKFTTPAAGNIHLNLFYQNQDYGLVLRDAGGKTLAASNLPGTAPEILNVQAPAGTYYAYVYGINGASSLRCYVLEISNGSWLNLLEAPVDERSTPSERDYSAVWRVFPNPTSDVFTVEGPEQPDAQAYLYDLQGRLLQQMSVASGRAVFNLSDYPSGVYCLRLEAAGRTKMGKILKR